MTRYVELALFQTTLKHGQSHVSIPRGREWFMTQRPALRVVLLNILENAVGWGEAPRAGALSIFVSLPVTPVTTGGESTAPWLDI